MKHSHKFENSSMLHDCGYDDESKEMTVTFVNGREYTYEDVDKSIYDMLASSPSAGKYFNSIKGTLKVKE